MSKAWDGAVCRQRAGADLISWLDAREEADMPKYKVATMLTVAGTLLLASPIPGQSAPLMPNPLIAKSLAENANKVEVRYGWGGGWRGGWGGWRGGWGWGAGALAGAAIAGAVAAPYYYGGGYYPYYSAPYPAYDYYSYPAYSYYGYPNYYGGYYRPYWRRAYYY
jgi:hypothetical protein